MPNRSLCIKVPGKLMIAGEFAVLEQGQQLVVMAVDRFVYTTIVNSEKNHLTFENFDLNQLSWTYDNGVIMIASSDHRTHFVKQAMQITLNYLEEQGITPEQFSLTIKSELDDPSGIKYGLGSSAAVVTSVTKAILTQFLPTSPSKKLIFKLAAIAHVITQGNGSGADIAASTYGGMLQYASFQADWLIKMYEQTQTLTAFINMDWTFLSIQQLDMPQNVSMYIGWTGTPASTANLVNKVLQLKIDLPKHFKQFITASESAVNMFIEGIMRDDITLVLNGVRKNRQALRVVGEQAQTEIETVLLGELCNIAEQLSGAGKPSGAGGGDCGIAFMPSDLPARDLQQSWQEKGIIPLDIQIYHVGNKIK